MGFGTAYETNILKNILDYVIHKYRINKVLEYPITSLLNDFKYKGKATSIMPSEAHYDLVWSFCYFEHIHDSVQYIDEVSSKTDKYVMIIIQNNKNLGVILHWIYHMILRREWDHGKISKMSPRKLRRAIAKKGLLICEDGFHDVPWFIIDVYEFGNFLKKLVPSSLVQQKDIKPSRLERLPRIIKSFFAHHYHVLAEKPILANGDQSYRNL